MQTHEISLSTTHPQKRGIALVLVLVILSLLTVLMVAFFSFAKVENSNSRSYAETINSRVLTDTALNLFIAQLRNATSNLGTTKSWASQPGLIRRYDENGFEAAFKLYSSEHMIQRGDEFNPANEVPPTDWLSHSAAWVDLNSPVIRESETPGQPLQSFYPIAHPNALDVISGFEVVNAPGATDEQKIPMPVRWLYVLKDGSLATPISFDGETANFAHGAVTADNPITGRLAFWADDESAKVNINTASEGTFWDIPRIHSDFEKNFYALNQPVAGEFSRYPGHPAFTSLSPILGHWLGDPAEQYGNANARAQIVQRYAALTPRIIHGGSEAGSKAINFNNPEASRIKLSDDQDRLYSTVDEYVFRAGDLSANQHRQHNRLEKNQGADPAAEISSEILETTRFFLTANSQAPEVNLFNQPRLSLWPVQEDDEERNVIDRLLAFCATTNLNEESPYQYYLQRKSVHEISSSSDDKASSLSPIEDFDGIERNQQIYSYLQELTKRNIPGYGGNFADKHEEDTNQILTQKIDLLRSNLNTYAYGLPTNKSAQGFTYAPPRFGTTAKNALSYGTGQVIPLVINQDDTKGFGRSMTITEAALVIYPTQAHTSAEDRKVWVPVPTAHGDLATPGKGVAPTWVQATHSQTARAFLLLEFFNPSVGLPAWSPFFEIEINGLDQFGLRHPGTNNSWTSLNLPPKASLVSHSLVDRIGGSYGDGSNTSTFGIFQPFFRGGNGSNGLARRTVTSPDPWSGYSFHSIGDIQIPGSLPILPAVTEAASSASHPSKDQNSPRRIGNQNLELWLENNNQQSVPISIKLKTPRTSGLTDDQRVFQTINLEFPPAHIPRPYVYSNNSYETNLQNRIAGDAYGFNETLIRPGDVVRSLEPDKDAPPAGDFRLYSARRTVPASWFTKGGIRGKNLRPSGIQLGSVSFHHPVDLVQYDDADAFTGRFAHGLRQNNHWQVNGQFRSNLWNEHRRDGDDNNGGHTYAHPFYRVATQRVSGLLVKGYKHHQDFGRTNNFSDAEAIFRLVSHVTARDLDGAYRSDGEEGDFDSGFGRIEDGPYINKPDGGNGFGDPDTSDFSGQVPGGYFHRGFSASDSLSLNHAPNRQVASAVAFGSLPTGVKRELPWETLLFTPHPAGRNHPGAKSPHDHLLLDWWWMPIAQPYPISQPLSTAGKININYEILPFRYIKRRTPIHSLLKDVKIGVIPRGYSSGSNHRQGTVPNSRFDIEVDNLQRGTLKGFEDKFNNGEIFRSASEICEISLVPKTLPGASYEPGINVAGASYSNMQAWWEQFGVLTGDNLRESPYNHIYPRATTKSNTFRLHMWVQRLEPSQVEGSPDSFRFEQKTIIGSYRGSAIVERFVDPNDPSLPDFIKERDQSLDDFYRLRVTAREEFNP